MGQPKISDKREPVKIELRKNDQVKVITGSDKGKSGRVLEVDRAKGRVTVENVAMMKRHTKKNPAKQIAGGIAEREASIAVSNVMILCPKCGAVRVKHVAVTAESGKTKHQRVCHKCSGPLDRK